MPTSVHSPYERPRDEFNASVITAKACIDPRGAVAVIESLTTPSEPHLPNPAHRIRLRPAEVLGIPSEVRWPRLWRDTGCPTRRLIALRSAAIAQRHAEHQPVAPLTSLSS